MGTSFHRRLFDVLSTLISSWEEHYLESPPITAEQISVQQEGHDLMMTMIRSLSEIPWNDVDYNP
jgi:hypothetical protein